MTFRRDLDKLSNDQWDIAVIGGGILGAGIARDAALRGLRVALVEKSDFGSGTSSRSTKLAHGGFRYLEHWQFGLVAEACRERELLLKLAPHLVWPLPFLLPVYDGDPRPMWKLRAGMKLYDLMARLKPELRHRALSADETLAAEPAIDPAGLRGAIAFHDCQMDDARLCLETILDAETHGAACLNYCEVTGMETVNSRVSRMFVEDRTQRQTAMVRAKVFINAAGPWVEQVAGRSSLDQDREIALSPTKGVHLVLRRFLQRHGVYFQSRRDDRMIFLLPYGHDTLLGTTDTNFARDPDQAHAEDMDVRYLLDRLHDVMPHHEISPNDMITSFAGVRPLLKASRSAPSHRPREHRLVRLGENLLTIAGGKYTTFRAISEEVVDAACDVVGRRRVASKTRTAALPNRRPSPSGQQVAAAPLVWESDITHACREEAAVRLVDVMRRRTRLALSESGNEATARVVAEIMARECRWNDDQLADNLREYVDEWQRSRPWQTGL